MVVTIVQAARQGLKMYTLRPRLNLALLLIPETLATFRATQSNIGHL